MWLEEKAAKEENFYDGDVDDDEDDEECDLDCSLGDIFMSHVKFRQKEIPATIFLRTAKLTLINAFSVDLLPSLNLKISVRNSITMHHLSF